MRKQSSLTVFSALYKGIFIIYDNFELIKYFCFRLQINFLDNKKNIFIKKSRKNGKNRIFKKKIEKNLKFFYKNA